MDISWESLKSFVDGKSLSVQWVDLGNQYLLAASDGPFILRSKLQKTTPANSDQDDFETNYKDSGNKPPQTKVIQGLGTDTFSLYTIGFNFSCTKNSTTTHDLLIDSAVGAIRGGLLHVTNSVVGDSVSVDVIDKDDVLGFGGTPSTPIVLATYVNTWMVFPSPSINELMDISIGKVPAPGLYVRLSYTSTGILTNPQCLLNLISYVVS